MTLIGAFSEGLGGTLGSSMAVNAPFLSTGNVWYVHSGTGTNAAAPAGRNRMKPLATLAQAQTNAAAGDTIVLLDGHAETYTAALAISKALTIIGEGESDGVPTVTFTNNSAAANTFTVSEFCDIRNIKFAQPSQANSAYSVDLQSVSRLVGCYFECGQYTDGAAVRVGATGCHLRSCTFVSVATALTAQPLYALYGQSATAAGLYLEGCTFDGGTAGFSGHWAVDLSETDLASDYPSLIEGMALLRGADVLLPGTGNIKVVGPLTITGGSVIDWNGTAGGGGA